MAKKTKERYYLEGRLRQMKKDLAYTKRRPSESFMQPFSKTGLIKHFTDKIKTLERKLK
jgi:ATP-dependent Lon protease